MEPNINGFSYPPDLKEEDILEDFLQDFLQEISKNYTYREN